MQARQALVAAIATGALAVAMVAVDLNFNVTVTLEAKQADGSWKPVASTISERSHYGGSDCAGNTFRVTVRNGQLWGGSWRVGFAYTDGMRTHFTVDEKWSLGAGEQRSAEMTIPPDAYNTTNVPPAYGKPSPASVQVLAFLDEQYGPRSLSACSWRAA